MREIIFRGIDKETGEWRYGYYVKNEYISKESIFVDTPSYKGWSPKVNDVKHIEAFIISSFSKNVEGEPDLIEVLPETVGQFTGLLDKNGVKIFEHDKGIDPQGNIGEVFYHNESAQFAIRWKRKDGTFDTDTCFGYFEIHTNPQLIGGGE